MRLRDHIGTALLISLVAWIGTYSGGGVGHAQPVMWLLTASAAAFVTGRWSARRYVRPERILPIALLGAIVLSWPALLRAAGAPTGYANANATLTSMGTLVALISASNASQAKSRLSWVLTIACLMTATVLTGSLAGFMCLLAGLSLVALALPGRAPRTAVAGGLIVVSVALGITAAIAAGASIGGLGDRTGVRGDLWRAAVDLMRSAPLYGRGHGGFEALNPVSRDPDLRWAHHGYLQAGAEYGVVGLGLILSMAGLLWSELWSVAKRDPAAGALGASCMTVVALHATVDHVWHAPAVLVTLALVLGASTTDCLRPGHGRRCASAWEQAELHRTTEPR